ncbi:MAG: hypothetical protein IJK23_12610 [Clostridia bacterium]|nr:hypothetical protein [Clostridia bacterium]
MKKRLIFALSLLIGCVIPLCGCSVFPSKQQTSTPTETPAATSLTQQTNDAAEPTETAAGTADEPSSEQNDADAAETSGSPADASSLYDGVKLDELWDSELVPADEIEALLCDFQQIGTGTAGSSLRVASREVSFLRLAKEDSSVVRERLNNYLDGLTPVQTDYYSYNVSYIYDALRKDMEYYDDFSWLTDLTGEDPGDVEPSAVEALMSAFTGAFDAHGVKYVWKTFDISSLAG